MNVFTRWRRVIWPAALLGVFFTVVRDLPNHTNSTAVAVDCDRIARDDVAALERCLTLHPDDVELMTDLGGAYEQSAQWARAETVYRRALTIDAADGDIRVRLGNVLLQRGDAAGARREGAAALAVQPGRAAAFDLVRRASAAGGDR